MRDRGNTLFMLQATRAEIENTRNRLAGAMGHLRQDVRSALPWHVWAQKNPLGLILVAAMVGFVFGIQSPKRLQSGGTHANACTEE